MTSPAGYDAKERRRQTGLRGADAVLGDRLGVTVQWPKSQWCPRRWRMMPPFWRPCAGSSTGHTSSRKRACGAAATRALRSPRCLPLSAESTLQPLTSMVALLVRYAPVSGTATRAGSVRLRSSPRMAVTALAVSLSHSRKGGRGRLGYPYAVGVAHTDRVRDRTFADVGGVVPAPWLPRSLTKPHGGLRA